MNNGMILVCIDTEHTTVLCQSGFRESSI